MKKEDYKKYCIEEFNKILPRLNALVAYKSLTNQQSEYELNGIKFLMRLNNNIIEIALASEKHIFPTLAYIRVNASKAKLLHYRVGYNFSRLLYSALDKSI